MITDILDIIVNFGRVTESKKDRSSTNSNVLIGVSVFVILISVILISLDSKSEQKQIATDFFELKYLISTLLLSILNIIIFYKLKILRDVNITAFLIFFIASFSAFGILILYFVV